MTKKSHLIIDEWIEEKNSYYIFEANLYTVENYEVATIWKIEPRYFKWAYVNMIMPSSQCSLEEAKANIRNNLEQKGFIFITRKVASML